MEFTFTQDRLEKAKLKLFEEGKITEYLSKNASEEYNIEEVMADKNLAMRYMLPEVE